MFYPFKPAKSPDSSKNDLQNIEERIRRVKRKWASRLQERSGKLAPKRLRAILILSGLIASATAGALLYRGLTGQPPVIYRFNLSFPSLAEPISVPKGPSRQQALDDYLDSLEKAFILDSLQNSKPEN